MCGSSFGGVKGRDQVPQLVDRYLAGDIDVDPFISHRLTLDEVNRGFELMEAQDGIRSVIERGKGQSLPSRRRRGSRTVRAIPRRRRRGSCQLQTAADRLGADALPQTLGQLCRPLDV